MRKSEMKRKTSETDISMSLELDCVSGKLTGSSGIGFFDHMLNSFCVHGGFCISLSMSGDLNVDGHHSVEDTGIVLGKLFAEILADKVGINRFGSAFVPMDESLARAVIDISGRPYLVFDADFSSDAIGDYDTQLTLEFFRALAYNMGATLHMKVEYGINDHHKTEALFKAAARAVSEAVKERGGEVLSSKGVL